MHASSAALPIAPNVWTMRSSRADRAIISKSDAQLATADATKRAGSDRLAPYQTGTAVLHRRTPVYPARGIPTAPAAIAAVSPAMPGSRSDAPVNEPPTARTHDPILNGERTLNTRSMLKKRDGLPRSTI